MRNTSIILNIIGLSVLVFGLITSIVVKNQQVASIATLTSVTFIGVSVLLTSLSIPSHAEKITEDTIKNEEYRVLWDRIRDVQNNCAEATSDTNRWYDTQLEDLTGRVEDLESKRK